jgi:hypothetical protein
MEILEPRQRLAAEVMISEFLARNDAGLRDPGGEMRAHSSMRSSI